MQILNTVYFKNFGAFLPLLTRQDSERVRIGVITQRRKLVKGPRVGIKPRSPASWHGVLGHWATTPQIVKIFNLKHSTMSEPPSKRSYNRCLALTQQSKSRINTISFTFDSLWVLNEHCRIYSVSKGTQWMEWICGLFWKGKYKIKPYPEQYLGKCCSPQQLTQPQSGIQGTQ